MLHGGVMKMLETGNHVMSFTLAKIMIRVSGVGEKETINIIK